MLIDRQSTVDAFSNRTLLTGIKEVKCGVDQPTRLPHWKQLWWFLKHGICCKHNCPDERQKTEPRYFDGQNGNDLVVHKGNGEEPCHFNLTTLYANGSLLAEFSIDECDHRLRSSHARLSDRLYLRCRHHHRLRRTHP